MLKPSSSRDFAQPRQPDASASSQPARPSQLPFRRATLAEQNSNPLRDPEDMTGYVLDGQREQLEAVFQSPESQFPTDYSRNYMGWALFDTQHNMLAEICRRVSENNPKPGYRILGDQLGTLRAFLMRSGVRVVTDRKGLKWGQDAFREATAEEEKKSPHNSSDVTANIPASEVSKLVSLFGAEGSFKDEYSKSWQGWPLWCALCCCASALC